jgi:hypothetical protein
MLNNLPFELTKFVNGYLASWFEAFLQSQPKLETFELHSGEIASTAEVGYHHHHLKTVACPSRLLSLFISVSRLRLDFQNSTAEYESDVLRMSKFSGNVKSLAIFLKQKPDGRQSHFLEIMRVILGRPSLIKHLEIHQFLPTPVPSLISSN